MVGRPGWLVPVVRGFGGQGPAVAEISIEVLEISFVPLQTGTVGLGVHRLPLPDVPESTVHFPAATTSEYGPRP